MADGPLDSLLEGSEEWANVPWTGATGVDWSRLGQSLIGTAALTIATGVAAITQGYQTAITRVVDGFAGFTTALQNSIAGNGIEAIRGAWSFDLSEFGLLALPLSIGVMIATFWILSQGVAFLRGRYL